MIDVLRYLWPKVAAFVALAALVGVSGGCERSVRKPKYGVDHNEQRRARGIPVIPNDWTMYTISHKRQNWINPTVRSGQWDHRSSIRFEKHIVFDT